MRLRPVVHKSPCVSSAQEVPGCSSGYFITREVGRGGSWANGGRTSGQKLLSLRGSSAEGPWALPAQSVSPELRVPPPRRGGGNRTGRSSGQAKSVLYLGGVGVVFLTSTSLLPDALRWAGGTVCNPRGLPGRAKGVLSQDSASCCRSLWVRARQLHHTSLGSKQLSDDWSPCPVLAAAQDRTAPHNCGLFLNHVTLTFPGKFSLVSRLLPPTALKPSPPGSHLLLRGDADSAPSEA